MPPLRIAFVLINANRREGTSRAVVEVAERLALRHNVTLVARTISDVDTSRIRFLKIDSPTKPSVAEFAVFRSRAERMLMKADYDIVHSAGCNVWQADVFAIQTIHPKKFEIARAVQRNEGIGSLRRLTRYLFDRVVLHSEKKAYKSFNQRGRIGYLPVSTGTEKELRHYFPVDDGLIQVIPNGADTDKFHPKLRETHRNNIRKELAYADDRILLLFAGGEWRRKELRLAIESMLLTKCKDSVLIVAGSDPQESDYFGLVKRLNLQDRVRFLGFRKDIDRLYAAADIFLFPSAYEAFSLATIEAAAVGLPVIMCEISGAAELLGDGKSGRIVARDARSIALAIDEIASDGNLRQNLSEQARAKVLRCFTWDKIAEMTESFYYRLLDTRRSEKKDRSAF